MSLRIARKSVVSEEITSSEVSPEEKRDLRRLGMKDSWGSMEGLLGDGGRGLKAPGAGLRECLPGRRHPCFLTWRSELNGLLVFQGTWIMLSDQEKLTGINAKFVPKGLSSLVDMA